MTKCSFCGNDYVKGSGKTFVKDNGTLLFFCATKCEKNMLKLKRDARKFKWTAFYVKSKKKIKAK